MPMHFKTWFFIKSISVISLLIIPIAGCSISVKRPTRAQAAPGGDTQPMPKYSAVISKDQMKNYITEVTGLPLGSNEQETMSGQRLSLRTFMATAGPSFPLNTDSHAAYSSTMSRLTSGLAAIACALRYQADRTIANANARVLFKEINLVGPPNTTTDAQWTAFIQHLVGRAWRGNVGAAETNLLMQFITETRPILGSDPSDTRLLAVYVCTLALSAPRATMGM